MKNGKRTYLLIIPALRTLLGVSIATAADKVPQFYPNAKYQGVTQGVLQQDLAACRSSAEQYMAGQTEKGAAAKRGAGGAVRGAAVGALAGAVTGQNVGRATGPYYIPVL